MSRVHQRGCVRLVLPVLLAAGPAAGDDGRAVRAVRASAVWPEGARDEPDRAGLARMLAASWTAGCGARAGRDAFELVIEVPVGDWQDGLAALAACLQPPRVTAVVVDAARRRLLAERAARTPAQTALRAMEDILFAGEPHGVDPLGNDATLAAIDPDLMMARVVELGAPRIQVTGAVDRKAAFRWLKEHLPVPVPAPTPTPSPAPAPTSRAAGRQVFIYRNVELAEVAIGYRARVDAAAIDRALRGAATRTRAVTIDGAALRVTLSSRPADLARAMTATRAVLEHSGLTWDDAVIATVMPPLASPEAARRARGVIRRLKAGPKRKRSRR